MNKNFNFSNVCLQFHDTHSPILLLSFNFQLSIHFHCLMIVFSIPGYYIVSDFVKIYCPAKLKGSRGLIEEGKGESN